MNKFEQGLSSLPSEENKLEGKSVETSEAEDMDKNAESIAANQVDLSTEYVALVSEKMAAYNENQKFLAEERKKFGEEEALIRRASRGENLEESKMAELTQMSEEWATILRRSQGGQYSRINLMGVKEMSDECIEILAKDKGSYMASLVLGVEKLSVKAAADLSQFTGHQLYLDRVKELNLEQASALTQADREEGIPSSRKNYNLGLDGVRKITPEVAEAIAKNDGNLDLGIEELTPEVSKALSKHQGSRITLNHLRTITPEAAKYLVGYKGELTISVQEPISEETAKILAQKIKGERSLSQSLVIFDGEGIQWHEKNTKKDRSRSGISQERLQKSRSWKDRFFSI